MCVPQTYHSPHCWSGALQYREGEAAQCGAAGALQGVPELGSPALLLASQCGALRSVTYKHLVLHGVLQALL